MREAVHDLNFDQGDKERATVRLQSWWRGLLVRRVVRILHIWKKLFEVQRVLEKAALMIQGRFRGVRAKHLVRELRNHRQELADRAKRAQDEEVRRKIVKIQTAVRNWLARKEVRRRRMARAKALEEEELRDTAGGGGGEHGRRGGRGKRDHRGKGGADRTREDGDRAGGGRVQVAVETPSGHAHAHRRASGGSVVVKDYDGQFSTPGPSPGRKHQKTVAGNNLPPLPVTKKQGPTSESKDRSKPKPLK